MSDIARMKEDYQKLSDRLSESTATCVAWMKEAREARQKALEEAHDAAADALGEDGDICCYRTHSRTLSAISALMKERKL